MKKIIIIFVASMVFLTFFLFSNSGAKAINYNEEKIYANIFAEEDYDLNSVIVILNNETSSMLKEYECKDFIEINPKDVKDLTYGTKEILKNQMENKLVLDNVNDIRYRVDIDVFHQILEIKLNSCGRDSVIEAILELQEREDILYVGQNFYFETSSTNVNDPKHGPRYYSDNEQRFDLMKIDGMWDITCGSNDVLVGVIDSGIQYDHEDLYQNIYGSMHMSFINGIQTPVTNPEDDCGHGTHVAGIIGAKGNNNIGIAGVCWNVKLVSLKAANSSGSGLASWTALAIDYATSQNIPLINISLTFSGDDNNLLKYSLMNYPGLACIAAGNYNVNLDTSSLYFPAKYNMNNTIIVGNSDHEDERFYSSSYGKKTVDLFACGAAILSTFPTTLCAPANCNFYPDSSHDSYGYHALSGTSMATPFVTGVAAAILSLRPSLTSERIKELILDNVDRIDYLEPYCKTGGRLNAFKAVRAATEPETFMGDVNGDGKSDMILSTKSVGEYMFCSRHAFTHSRYISQSRSSVSHTKEQYLNLLL